MPKVLRGVVGQTTPCCLMPITSERSWEGGARLDRKNIWHNWQVASRHHDNGPFVGMDSDVVLTHPKAVETLLSNLHDGVSMTTIASKPHPVKQSIGAHQLFAIKDAGWFGEIKYSERYGKCPICHLVSILEENGEKVRVIEGLVLEECPRLFVRLCDGAG
jgi:hypothetical protein